MDEKMIKFALIFCKCWPLFFFFFSDLPLFLKLETKFEVLKQKYQKMFQKNAEKVSDWRHDTHHNDSQPKDTEQSNKTPYLASSAVMLCANFPLL
jgi:hypothetical protein